MLPDRVSNPGPLTYESGALPIAPRGPASPSEQHPGRLQFYIEKCGVNRGIYYNYLKKKLEKCVCKTRMMPPYSACHKILHIPKAL